MNKYTKEKRERLPGYTFPEQGISLQKAASP